MSRSRLRVYDLRYLAEGLLQRSRKEQIWQPGVGWQAHSHGVQPRPRSACCPWWGWRWPRGCGGIWWEADGERVEPGIRKEFICSAAPQLASVISLLIF